MNKIILADSQAIFRAGTAKVLALDEDLRIIAQCSDLDRMHHAITTFPGAIVLFAASLRPDMDRLSALLETTGSRGIVIAENNDPADAYLKQGFHGVVFRNVTGKALVDCVRSVAAGETWLPPQVTVSEAPEEDRVGMRVCDRLTPKEMRIVALIVQGRKNREIAIRQRPRIFVHELGLGMAQFLDALVHVFVGDFRIVVLHRQAFIILQLNLRYDFEFGREAQRLAGLQVYVGDIGLSDHFQVFRLEPVVQVFRDEALQDLLPDLAGKLLADDRGGRLPGPETRQLGTLLDLGHRPAGFGLHFLNGHGDLQRVLATFY